MTHSSFPISATTTTMAHSSFSTPFFTQLVYRLRHANARYNQIAHESRHTRRPTHHAKRRACRAGLRIDTSKADPTAQSAQPLPVLDGGRGPTRSIGPECLTTEAETNADVTGSARDGPNVVCMLPSLGLALRSLPEVVVVQKRQSVTFGRLSLSPPQLGLGSSLNLRVGDADAHDLSLPVAVPGAPRWRLIPLPEDAEEGALEAMTGSKKV